MSPTQQHTNQSVPEFLINLPDFLTPAQLAELLHLKRTSLYQRIWRKRDGENDNTIPKLIKIPGCNRVIFNRDDVIEWFLSAQNEHLIMTQKEQAQRKLGRPSIADKIKRGEL